MPKILLINNAYPSEKHPKNGGYVRSIEECLFEAGLHVDKIVLDSDYGSFFQKIKAYIKFHFKLINFQGYSKYDYIYIHHFPNVFPALVFRFSRLSNIVINFHGGDIIPVGFFQKILNKISYWFLPEKAKIVVPTNYFKQQVLKKIPKLENQDFYISPSGGVDTGIFKPMEKGRNENDLKIGFASGIEDKKGIKEVLYLLQNENFANHEFHIIEYGKQRQRYIHKLEHNKKVVLYPIFEKRKMPEFYSTIDVLFFPSKSESLGLVALEAMSCNIPVIGPNDFALKEIIVQGLTGEKYDKMKEENILKAFERFQQNRDNYDPRRQIENKYSKKSVINHFKQIFS